MPPIQPTVDMIKVFTLTSQSQVFAHRPRSDGGSGLAVAEFLRAPNSVLPMLAAAAAHHPLAPPGCAITPPARGLSTGPAVPKRPAAGKGRDPWEGGRPPLPKKRALLSLRRGHLSILGGFLWHSPRTV